MVLKSALQELGLRVWGSTARQTARRPWTASLMEWKRTTDFGEDAKGNSELSSGEYSIIRQSQNAGEEAAWPLRDGQRGRQIRASHGQIVRGVATGGW